MVKGSACSYDSDTMFHPPLPPTNLAASARLAHNMLTRWTRAATQKQRASSKLAREKDRAAKDKRRASSKMAKEKERATKKQRSAREKKRAAQEKQRAG